MDIFQIQNISEKRKVWETQPSATCSISKGSNYSSGLNFTAIEAEECSMKFITKFNKRICLIVAAGSSGNILVYFL
jgi:hypothetical protein